MKIRSFSNQDLSRYNVARLAARAVEDILYVLDSATAPSVDSSGLGVSQDEVESYKRFRDWFGPQVGATIQGLVVGPLLTSLTLHDDGLVDVETVETRQFEDSNFSVEERTKARLVWLAEEVPSLIETYGQLTPQEQQTAAGVCKSVWSIVQGVYDHELALAILPEAEKWFMFAQPGAKILRGDQDAVEALLEFTDRLKEQVDTFEGQRSRAMKNLKEDCLTTDDVPTIQDELNRVEATIADYEKRLAAADKRAREIREKLAGV